MLMRKFISLVLLLLSSALFAQTATPEYKIEKLADGVYALIRQDPVGWMVVSNCVFIVNDDDVVVVDTGGAMSLARQMIADLKKITNKPVTYVVNTHWHDDHILGNAAYKEAFPKAEFVAHRATREYLPTKGVTARESMEKGAPEFSKFLQEQVDKKISMAGGEMGDEEANAYRSDIRLVNRYLAEVKQTPIVLPTITLEDRLTLYRGDRVIDIRYLGRSHTSGDIVVYLPKEKILITGDMVISPVPLVGSDQSHVADWSATLEKARALGATIIVPGHGPVLHDDKQMELLSRMFASITAQTKAGVEKGQSLDDIRKAIDLKEFRDALAGDSPVRRVLFANYVKMPGTASAYADVKPN
ncbi:MAG TPA: MBL fold metallo-hydrolase [Terriglobales bacterium]|nr:MBL fold metallo-hydrolase [Terriglobales bacterium]